MSANPTPQGSAQPDQVAGAAHPPHPSCRSSILLFNAASHVWLRRGEGGFWGPSATAVATSPAEADAAALAALRQLQETLPAPAFSYEAGDGNGHERVWLLLSENPPPLGDAAGGWFTLGQLLGETGAPAPGLAEALRRALGSIGPHIIRIPYLNQSEHEYIYRFRTERERNRSVYSGDASAQRLYQSELCAAIKLARRSRERISSGPARLDFGAVEYVIPSHFGFCLGVQNAIERAYETLSANPGRRVFMLSELIHNPFVNEDLLRRGLRYLQTDKGRPIADPGSGRPYWEGLSAEDIVIIPAFGATDEDKRRLILRGLAINRHDATCMLVEKVWKAARRYGQDGYTVIIHGKSEHEETKATFSNAARHAPCVVVRDRAEAAQLAAVIREPDASARRQLFATAFSGRHSPGFDAARDLSLLAVVNQTTLLRNETLSIIDSLTVALASAPGGGGVVPHLHPGSRGDTLCYATQVNQDALARALQAPVDAALVVGGKNSSNTYQLYRLCEQALGERAHYIQSERNLPGLDRVSHYAFPAGAKDLKSGQLQERPLLPAGLAPGGRAWRILLTGGASCPDGILQQVITRLNGFFPREALRPMERVLEELERETAD